MGIVPGIRDYRGWLSVDGPRFYAFLPFGSRSQLEHDTLCLAEGYQWDPLTVKKMACSERHRYVKMKEAIAAEQKARKNNQTTVAEPQSPTGISPRAEIPSIGLDYSGGAASQE
jgi:hypothetical protein